MRIAITVDWARRRWHDALADGLAADGHQVSIAMAETSGAPPVRGVALLLAFERTVYGSKAGGLFDPAPHQPNGASHDTAELALDLTAGEPAKGGAPCWSVRFDGVAGEAGLLSALLDARAPRITIVDAEEGTAAPIAAGLPALENPRLLGAGLDAVLTRAVGLVRRSVRAFANGCLGPDPAADALPQQAGAAAAALTFGIAGLSARVANRLARMAGADHRWQTGWQRLDAAGSGVQGTLRWPDAGYAWLPDDGKRFYADPFLFTAAGRTVLFVEEYPYATGRGLISALAMTPEGPVGTPRPVLELPVHLSYPSVFARDGAVWMIPETSGNRTIELYRANPFPDRWVLDCVLVEDVAAGDATLLEHDGHLYLFAATNNDGGSTWDQLSIFHAATLRGPWRPHDVNPVLIDASTARPAGFPFMRDGALIRPAQDCRAGYGAGLTFCRIDRLDPTGFTQTAVSRLGPDPRWRASGAHTLNVGSGFEVIDRIGPRR